MQHIKHKEVIKMFERIGYHIERESKHTIMRCDATKKTIAIPRHKEVNFIIVRRLAKEHGIDLTNLLELMR